MAGQRGSDAASDLKDWLELPTQQREMQSRDTGLASLDRSLTPVTTSLQAALAEQDSRFAEQHSPDGPLSRSALAPDLQPTITFTSSGPAAGLVKEATTSGPAPLRAQAPLLTTPLPQSIDSTASSSGAASPSAHSPRSPLNSSGHSFFSSFRPTSPKVPTNNGTTSRDEATSIHSPIPQRGVSRERDHSHSGSEASARNRRPSSVFDHVGGMLDRFGRRLHSRSEMREDRKRVSNSNTAAASGSALDSADDPISAEDHAPNETFNNASPLANTIQSDQASPSSTAVASIDTSTQQQQGVASSSSAAAAATGSAAGGLSWSPIVDEGRRRPNMTRNRSSGSSNGAADANRLSATSARGNTLTKRQSVMERTLIQVTEDNERFSVVEISGLNSAAAIKEKMMSKLHLFEEDPSSFAFSRTEIGQSGPGGPKMSDDELLALCWQSGDEKGTLKFLLHQTSHPTHPNHSMRPPPPASPLIGQRGSQWEHASSTNTAASSAKITHSKSGSLSSRSSVGEVLSHGEFGTPGEGSSDASGRGATGLQRIKATNRRAGGPEEHRSPVLATRSPQQATALLLSSLPEQDQDERRAPLTRPAQALRNERRRTQSPLSSPTADLQDKDRDRDQDFQRGGNRRDVSATRPNSSQASFRNSMHGQYESESGTSSSRMGVHPLSPRSKQISLQAGENRSSHQAGPNSAGDLPRSLQPGGKDPRGIDAADAAHMYLSHASPSGNDGGNHAHGHQQTALGIHNARSVDDMRRRSRMVMPPLSEMPTMRNDQAGYHALPPHPAAPAPSFPGNRQASADANLSHQRPPAPFGPGSAQLMQDPRYNSFAGAIPKPRASTGSEMERRGGPPYTVPNTPYQQQHLPQSHPPAMSPRPPYEMARPNPALSPRQANLVTAPLARPMTPGTMQHQHQFDPRYASPAPHPSPRPIQYANEFGSRMQSPPHVTHHHSDPRMMRPHTMHEQQRYRPPGAVLSPGGQARPPMIVPHREDPFTSTHFPASSSRVVSEYQRNPNGVLQPGMTVQETMQMQIQRQQQQQQQAAMSPSYTSSTRPADQREAYMRSQDTQTQASRSQPVHQPHSSVHSLQQHPPPQSMRTDGPLSARTANNKVPNMVMPVRPSTAAPTASSGPATERSSGSSFATNSSADTFSHRRNFSFEERHRPASVEEAYSAPTSARTSRSESVGKDGRKQGTQAAQMTAGDSADAVSPLTDSELPYSSRYDRRHSLEDEDLINMRPLPKVPSAKSGAQDGKSQSAMDNDEGTFRAAEWKQMLSTLEAEASRDDDSSKARAISSSNLLSPKRSETDESESSGTSHQTVMPARSPKMKLTLPQGGDEDDGGTFNSFASFDDEDEYDEGGTWAKPLDTVAAKVQAATHVESKRDSGDGTLRPGDAGMKHLQKQQQQRSSSPRRPILTLSIDPSVHNANASLFDSGISPKSVSLDTARLQPLSSTDSSNSGPSLVLPSPASSGIHRRTSFARRDVDWAFRPPPEQLYDNLDDFFPKHDLDKPVLENSAIVPSSPQVDSPLSEVRSSSPLQPVGGARSRFQHKKSIRIVAQDRKKFMQKAEAAEKRRAEGEGLSRRRSTKLWGTKVIEVTPGTSAAASTSSAVSLASAGSDSPQNEATSARPVFKWVKGDLIGKGTYGRVYLALNATTGEMIAVKQVELPTTDSDREDARQKGVVAALKSEIETLKDLDHPNIVSYLGFEETTSYLSIFLEYVPGGSVGSCLRKHGKLDEATIKSFLQQILAGLNYLHNRGILHRDLKADNLLVDFDGIVKISDFGTVRKSEDIYGNIASMSIQGSIFWMAPEVVSLSRAGYSAKVDIWSLGCVVLEMFAGRRPWSDEEAVQAMFKIGAERRAPPIPPDVRLSRAAAHFLKTCFAVDPAARPTAQRLLEHVFPHILPGWRFSESSLYRALHR